MKFGPLPPEEALGTVLAHSFRLPSGRRLTKGTVLDAEHVSSLVAEGVGEVVVCRLEADDIGEDRAAGDVAAALAGEGISARPASTGRANLVAAIAGRLHVDSDSVHAANQVHEAITVSTLAPGASVEAGTLVATVKIIPFGVPGHALDECLNAVGEPPIWVEAYRPQRCALIQTTVPGTSERLLKRSAEVLEQRVWARGSTLKRTVQCAHAKDAIGQALLDVLDSEVDVVLVLGATATVDRRDVIPAAIESIGGVVLHFGLPVDPGNLTLLARHAEKPVLGVPGCARAPRRNGFDVVLDQVLAGRMPSPPDLARLGVGGLWKEGAGRPQPRQQSTSKPSSKGGGIGAVLLAAGRSRRMGEANKLLEEVGGTPMVRTVAETLCASGVDPVVVVLGSDAARVRHVLEGLPLTFTTNASWAEGMGTSVAAGVAALPNGLAGALVALGDMPGVSRGDVETLTAAFQPNTGAGICVPVRDRKRGNPVLWGARYFEQLVGLSGDVGARALLIEHASDVCEVEVADDGVLTDVDTPEALAEARRTHGLQFE